MPRLFVAVDIPDDIKKRLTSLQTPIPTARWVKPEQTHLTLRFIGDGIPEEQGKAVQSVLADVAVSPFDLTVRGVGRFPPGNRKPPRVLWVGIENQPVLTDLHHQVETALHSLGFSLDLKGFSPHLTLARLKTYQPMKEVDTFLTRHAEFEAGSFTVSRFVLYSSVLSPQGSKYTAVAVYDLRR